MKKSESVFNDLEKYFQILPTLEKLLDEYDPHIKRENDIFFTPFPVVSFILRSTHSILKEKLNKSMGLANHTVRILDPAAGSSSFLITAAHLAIQEMTRKYGKENSPPFVRHFLLNNIYGIEKEIFLYAVSHLNFAHFFNTLNLRLQYNEQFPIYWSNSLENGAGNTHFNVILGNPPYSGHPANRFKWISEKIKDYFPGNQSRKPSPSEPKEKNLKFLQDDYIKFIRFAQEKIDENGEGVVGFITNNTYLDSPTSRGMRKSLMRSFNEIFILNLHGSIMKKEAPPDGSKDENVFDVRQGVAITFFIKKNKQGGKKGCKVYYSDVWGLRETKYGFLDTKDIDSIEWKRVTPRPGFYLFTPDQVTGGTGRSCIIENRYKQFFKVTDIFPVHSVGIVTARDQLTIKKNREEMFETVKHFIALDETTAKLEFELNDDTRDWQVKAAQKDIRESGIVPGKVVPILYRPFDIRYTYYTGKSRGFHCMPRLEVMRHMLKENLGLITVRQVAEKEFNHCFVTDTIVESRVTTSNRGICYVFPLYLYEKSGKAENIAENFRKRLTGELGGDIIPTGRQIFNYIYAVLFSRLYRKEYALQLRLDFPRIPFPINKNFFNEMAQLGEKLAAIHLLKSPELEGCGNSRHTALARPRHGTYKGPFLNDGQRPSDNFSNLPPKLLEYKICGYPVLQKLLKSFTGREITAAEVEHISRVVLAVDLTIKYEEKIDRLLKRFNLVSSWTHDRERVIETRAL